MYRLGSSVYSIKHRWVAKRRFFKTHPLIFVRHQMTTSLYKIRICEKKHGTYCTGYNVSPLPHIEILKITFCFCDWKKGKRGMVNKSSFLSSGWARLPWWRLSRLKAWRTKPGRPQRCGWWSFVVGWNPPGRTLTHPRQESWCCSRRTSADAVVTTKTGREGDSRKALRQRRVAVQPLRQGHRRRRHHLRKIRQWGLPLQTTCQDSFL